MNYKLLLLLSLALSIPNYACTRVLYNVPGQPVLAGANIDWSEDMKANLWVYPQGIQRDGRVTTINSWQI